MGALNYKLAPPLAAAIKANHSIIRDSTQRLATVRPRSELRSNTLMLIQNFRSSCESVISSAARVVAAIPTNSIADRQHHPTEIISSACPSSDGGTVRPSAVPVWRLRKNPP